MVPPVLALRGSANATDQVIAPPLAEVRHGRARLDGCRIESEAPLNLGLGAAALGLTPRFRMAEKTRDGVPTAGAYIRIPVRFVTPQRSAP